MLIEESKVDSSGTRTYRRGGATVTDPVLLDGSLTCVISAQSIRDRIAAANDKKLWACLESR
jgi:hypothetical protein